MRVSEGPRELNLGGVLEGAEAWPQWKRDVAKGNDVASEEKYPPSMEASLRASAERVARWPQWKRDAAKDQLTIHPEYDMTTEQQFEGERGAQPIIGSAQQHEVLSEQIKAEIARRAEAAKTRPISAVPGPGPHGWAPPKRESRRSGWSLAAQVATLFALVAMGWQAHSFVASLENEHLELRSSMDKLYAGLQDVRRSVQSLTLRIDKDIP